MMPRPRTLLLLLVVGVFAASTSASETAVGDSDEGQVGRIDLISRLIVAIWMLQSCLIAA